MPAVQLRLASLAALVVALTGSGMPVRAADPDPAQATVAARLAVSPLIIRLDIDAASAAVGQSVKARARVMNAGPSTVHDVTVSLRIEALAFVVRGSRQTIGQIQPGRTTSVGWALCARSSGTYLVLVQATLDGVTIESPAVVLTILDGTKSKC